MPRISIMLVTYLSSYSDPGVLVHYMIGYIQFFHIDVVKMPWFYLGSLDAC